MIQTIVQFSGGKDSMASLLWTIENITPNPMVVFCDTGWESQITYDYINEVMKKLNLPLVTLKTDKFDKQGGGLLGMVKKKGRFPSSQARFCTIELKSKPAIDHILDEVNDNVLVIQGIRKLESFNRSKMKSQCTFFKFYFEPYGLDKKGKLKYHTYRKKDIVAFREKFADDILRPVFEWTGQQVIDYIISKGFEPNPLYKMGMKRVGCFPCVLSNNRDIRSMMEFFPERLKYIGEQEVVCKSSFFGPDSIPKWAYRGDYPVMDDVILYLERKNATLDMFEDNEATSCMSFYGLCE